MKSISMIDFITRSKKVHGNKFDYSSVDYINMKTNVKIKCPNAHWFFQTPDNHLKGKGCVNCANPNGICKDKESFVSRSSKVHGNRYDYSKFEYVSNKHKSIIICNNHGEFLQTSNSHLSGDGCRKCYFESLTNSKDQVISNFRKIHGNKYDYSNFIYKNNRTKSSIICRVHGSFDQSASAHSSGSGCAECSFDRYRIGYDAFLRKARNVWGMVYSYDEISYIDQTSKMTIVCPKHGKFKLTPDSHLSKKTGCPKCSNNVSKIETIWLDNLGISDRQINLIVSDKKFKVDGFCKETNTIYEFYGDFWHGNPIKYNPNDLNKRSKSKFGDLYKKTIEKENFLKKNGFNLITIWESEFKNQFQK